MPRSKNPDKYPAVFKELLLAAFAAKNKGITWKCPDYKTAVRTKMQLYAYMNAMASLEETRGIPDELRDSKRFHQVQITTVTTAEGEGLIKLMNKNFTPEALAIQEALSGFGRLVTDTDDDKAAQAEAQAIIDAHEHTEEGDIEELVKAVHETVTAVADAKKADQEGPEQSSAYPPDKP